MNVEHLKTDILILGSGGAGLFAALHALKANPDLDITIVSKGLLGKCGCTRMVQGGYNVALNPGDSVERHFMDTIEGGKWLPHQELAWTLVTKAIERVHELENEIGCFFDRNPDGTLHGKAFAGQTFDRTVHKGDLTGIEIINRLMEQVWARPIRRLEEHRAVALIPAEDGALSGVLLIDVRSGEFRFVAAQAVLLATGGGPTMYRYHTPSGDKSMDGLAMALRLGLPLRDMEMVQFHPTGLLAGPDTRMTGTVLEEGLRGSGGHLLNGAMHRFMGDYDPKLERATRDVVSRAIYAEMRAGRTTPNGGVYIKMSHLGPAQSGEGVQGHGGPLPRLRFRSRRRPGRSGADRALFHGRRRLRGRHRDRALRAVRRRRGCQRHARRQPARRQWRRQLDGVRRHRRRRDAALDRRRIRAIATRTPTFSMPNSPARSIRSRETAGDLNALREKLLDRMWDEVGVVRDRASIERGLAALDAHRGGTSGHRRRRRRPPLQSDLARLAQSALAVRDQPGHCARRAEAREFARRAFPVRFPGARRSRHLDIHGGAAGRGRNRNR